MKYLWILTGANGAGKSTFYKKYLKDSDIPFVNADEIAKINHPQGTVSASKAAQSEAHQIFHNMLDSGNSFCYETVFSHKSKLDFIKEAKSKGFIVNLVYIHLEDSMLNLARVHQRVSEGGHPVPEDKILSRIPRTIDNIKEALSIADYVDIYDNSNDTSSHRLMASIEDGHCLYSATSKPLWLKDILSVILKKPLREVASKSSVSIRAMKEENLLSPVVAKLCQRCGGFLRGPRRVSSGVCSKCDPGYGKT